MAFSVRSGLTLPPRHLLSFLCRERERFGGEKEDHAKPCDLKASFRLCKLRPLGLIIRSIAGGLLHRFHLPLCRGKISERGRFLLLPRVETPAEGRSRR